MSGNSNINFLSKCKTNVTLLDYYKTCRSPRTQKHVADSDRMFYLFTKKLVINIFE